MSQKEGDRIRLTISCNGLKDLDQGVFGDKSDPCVWVYMKDDKNPQWVCVGETETFSNDLNPKFVRDVFVDNLYDGNPWLQFVVNDVDSLTSPDLIGSFEIKLEDLRDKGSKDSPLVNTKGEADLGKISIWGEVVGGRKEDRFKLKMKGVNIASNDVGGWEASDPYLKFLRISKDPDREPVLVAKTEAKNNTESPEWDAISINVWDLCNGKVDQKFMIQVFDKDHTSDDDIIATVEMTMADLFSRNPFNLLDKEAKKSLGQIMLKEGGIVRTPTFDDYTSAAPESKIHVTFAVDFTKAGGSIKRKSSDDSYQQMISQIGQLLVEKYKCLGAFNLLGFGGKFNNEATVSHCYEIKKGLKTYQEVSKAYMEVLNTVVEEDERNLHEVLRKAIDMADAQEPEVDYHVLIVLTHKSAETSIIRNDIVDASFSKLSIMVVGLGDEDDFKDMMEKLQYASPSSERLLGKEGQQGAANSKAIRNPLLFAKGPTPPAAELQALQNQFLQCMEKQREGLPPASWSKGSNALEKYCILPVKTLPDRWAPKIFPRDPS
mmetsp:Transcript_52033/g.106048  ORF Transcript_52033/g.106048 Transcript_52033/m.106048 type:complete len:547 (+) Transcript_52033:29-1669(+)